MSDLSTRKVTPLEPACYKPPRRDGSSDARRGGARGGRLHDASTDMRKRHRAGTPPAIQFTRPASEKLTLSEYGGGRGGLGAARRSGRARPQDVTYTSFIDTTALRNRPKASTPPANARSVDTRALPLPPEAPKTSAPPADAAPGGRIGTAASRDGPESSTATQTAQTSGAGAGDPEGEVQKSSNTAASNGEGKKKGRLFGLKKEGLLGFKKKRG
ncbi:hypothetical protein AURDEDRAFT_125218 [Auricularia subglabra TFB-10046 SS5]|nr:hypothetical protein AURDEDRAFT_125218 [Auricularia subglabra TFB-10046 SS5]